VSEVRCVVDASAVLAWVFNERGEDTVDRILPYSALSTVNLAEVLYKAAEEGASTNSLPEDLKGYGVTLEPFTVEDARLVEEIKRAARVRGVGLSLGDSCCLATALRLHVAAVGADQAWEALDLAVDIRPFR
jgi:PIN domain nuclease of toxin-antitoxin system